MDLRPLPRRRASERQELILRHLALVPPVAQAIKRRLCRPFPLDDLCSSGVVGLIEAAIRFSPDPKGDKEAQFRAFARWRIRGAILDSIRGPHWRNATMPGLGAAPDPLVDAGCERAHRSCDVARLFVGLTDQESRILRLRYWQELSPQDAAVEMRISHSKAKRLIARGLRKLRMAAGPDLLGSGDYTSRVPTKGSKIPQTPPLALLVDKLGALQEEIRERQKREKEIIKQIRERADLDAKPDKSLAYEGRMYLATVTARGSRQKVTDKAKVLVFLGQPAFLEHCGFSVEKAEKVLTPEQFLQVVTVDEFCSPRTVETMLRAPQVAKKAA